MRSRGFTLIEILVVMLLLVIILGMIGLRIGGDEQRVLQEESKRLALLIQNLQEEAVLEGRVLAVSMEPTGYRFMRLNAEGKFEELQRNEILSARELPSPMSVQSVSLDGALAGDGARIILSPTGEWLQAFVITLANGRLRWRVEGTLEGEIKTLAAES